MATINLLPWRDEYRQEKKREFFSALLLLAILACVACYIWFALTESAINNQQSRNALLKKEIVVLNAKVKEIEKLKKQREELDAKIAVIQNLQNKRPLVVHHFDEVVRAIPDGLYFKSFTRKGDVFNVKGIAESNNRVSALMRNFDRSESYQSPNLKNVVKNSFELTVNAASSLDGDQQEGGK